MRAGLPPCRGGQALSQESPIAMSGPGSQQLQGREGEQRRPCPGCIGPPVSVNTPMLSLSSSEPATARQRKAGRNLSSCWGSQLPLPHQRQLCSHAEQPLSSQNFRDPGPALRGLTQPPSATDRKNHHALCRSGRDIHSFLDR